MEIDSTEVARRLAERRPRDTFTCAVCGQSFTAMVRTGRTAPKYCSPKCNYHAWYERHKGEPKPAKPTPPASAGQEDAG